MSLKLFNKLVKLTASAFYDDITAKGDNQPKSGRSDNRGIAVVVLDALTRRQWVREEDLAKDLKLHLKQLRRTLRFFEEEKLVTRDHRKEVELKPLTDILHTVKDLEAPDYGTLQAKELSIEVAFSGAEEKQIKSESAPLKKLPPWMIKEGMKLTNEQRGVVMQESNTDRTSSMDDKKDEKMSIGQEVDDKQKLKAIETFKVDLNVEAVEPSADDEDDDGIDWEEG
ncbi:transcription initiation factor IIE subunit alpha [Tanacetum coccineum]